MLACFFVYLMCYQGGALQFWLCIIGFHLHHCCFFVFVFYFSVVHYSYTSFCVYLVYHYSIHLDVCIFIIFNLAIFKIILLPLKSLLKQLLSKWKWHMQIFSSFGTFSRFSFEIHNFFHSGSFGSLKKLILIISFFLLELFVQSIVAPSEP